MSSCILYIYQQFGLDKKFCFYVFSVSKDCELSYSSHTYYGVHYHPEM